MQGKPEFVYQNVSTPYQAGFFGEVNTLPKNLFNPEKSSEIIMVFPDQLKISKEKTNLEVEVKNSYFKGKYYLIECIYDENVVFFEHSKKIKENTFDRLKHI